MSPGPLSRLVVICRARPQLCAAGLLLVWTLIVRLPFLHIIHDDEAFYSVVASRWLRGELPYAASFDVKAPGVFALFAAVQAVFGASLGVMKGVEIAFTAAGAWGLFWLMARHVSWRAALWSSALYPVYSLILLSVSSPCQVVQATLTIWAFAFVLDALAARTWWPAAAAGLMIGLAVAVKQTAGFEALALLVVLLWKGRDWRLTAAFIGMAAVPMLGFAAYFIAAGDFADAYADIVTRASLRSQADLSPAPVAWYLDLLTRLGHYVVLMLPLMVVTCGAFLALLRRKRLKAALALPIVDLALIWYAGAAAGILVMRSLGAWYAVPLIAPCLILFVVVVCHGIDFGPRARPLWTAGFMALAAAQPLVLVAPTLTITDYSGAPDWRGNEMAARGLVAAGLQPGDNLLVLSRGQYIYLLTGALPRTRYFNAMHLLCPFPTPDADPLGSAFATRPKFVVMSDEHVAIGCVERQRLQRIRDILARDYVRLTTVTGAWDRFTLYRIR